MLRYLEVCFTDLSVVHQWGGVDHVGAIFFAGFSEGSVVAMVAQRQMPFDEWVKKIKCNHCGEMGPIKKDHPKLANDCSGSDQRNQDNCCRDCHNYQRDNRCGNQSSSVCREK